METKSSKIRVAVIDGISKGWTAKETAFHHNFTVEEVRATAINMKMSFPWTRIGIPPKYTKEAVPLSTLFGRHRHTSAHAAAQIQKVVKRMGPKHPEAASLLKIVSFLRERTIPEAWESRIKVSK